MTTLHQLLLASLLLCVFALNGCASAPVKPVGQAVSSQPLASIMPPAVTLNPGKVLPVWNPPAPVTNIWISAPSQTGIYILQTSANLNDWKSWFAFGVSSNSTHIFKLPVHGQPEFFRLEKAI